MDELTIAWCYAHLWLHIFGRKTSYDHCPWCYGTRPSKSRYD